MARLKSFGSALTGLALTGLCLTAQAQERMLNTVTVTAQRIDVDDLAAMPNVFIRVPADFIQFSLTCQSATRDAAERKTELETQFNTLVKWAADEAGYELFGGEAGEETIPLDTISFHEILKSVYGNRQTFELVLTADVLKDETFDGVKLRVTKKVEAMKTAGRVECYVGDDQYLGVRNIDVHRKTLLKQIAAEMKDMREIFGKSAVEVTGLEARVISQPSGSLIVDVFLPYKLTLTSEKE